MLKTYKITFKPAEPYFFGNEKNFIFPGQTHGSAYASSYFIKSEKTPSQSTILGALRYMFLVHKKSDFRYSPDERSDNENAVGKESFDSELDNAQDFGVIKKVSPVFIVRKTEDGENETLIPTPMNHRIVIADEKGNKKRATCYTPFSKYIKAETSDGEKLYADDFDVKDGLAHNYCAVENGKIYESDEIFSTDLRIGINRNTKRDGFFKKEYCMLKNKYAFAVYAQLDVDESAVSSVQHVFLGQGKSAFSVTFSEEENSLENTVKDFISRNNKDYQCIYCLGDSFIADFDDGNVLFCAVDTKDYRSFMTKEAGRIEKNSNLYRLLIAGSILYVKDAEQWIAKNKKENAENIGFNNFVTTGGNK